MACKLCGKNSGVPRPHKSCDKGNLLYDQVRAAARKHEQTRGGMETWEKWEQAWDRWQHHYKSKRTKTKTNNRKLL